MYTLYRYRCNNLRLNKRFSFQNFVELTGQNLLPIYLISCPGINLLHVGIVTYSVKIYDCIFL